MSVQVLVVAQGKSENLEHFKQFLNKQRLEYTDINETFRNDDRDHVSMQQAFNAVCICCLNWIINSPFKFEFTLEGRSGVLVVR
jgi:hypothetical protein